MTDAALICTMSSHEKRPGLWKVEGRICEEDGAFWAIEHSGKPWKAVANTVEKDIRLLVRAVRPGKSVEFKYVSGEAEHLIHDEEDTYGWHTPSLEEDEVIT